MMLLLYVMIILMYIKDLLIYIIRNWFYDSYDEV